MNYLWTGRLKGNLHEIAKKYTFSLEIDKNLASFDVVGSIAHVEMLVKQKIISKKDGTTIISALKKILDEINKGIFKFKEDDEDIHTAVERRLTEIIGTTGGKIHTARSRNDQIVFDEKIYLKYILPEIKSNIALPSINK